MTGSGLNFTQLGIGGVVAALLAVAVVVLWKDNKALRKQAYEDQQRMLPALTQASAAITQATNTMAEFAREATLLLRERR